MCHRPYGKVSHPMTTVATLDVELKGKDVNIDAMLNSVEQRLRAMDKIGQQAGAGIGQGIGRGARTASDSTLTLAQAQARLFSTTGQNHAAFATLSAAIGS